MDAMSNPQPSPYGPAGQPPRPPAAGFFDSLRRTGLVRTRDRWVGGVAGGVARRLGVDPVLVRCAWIVLCVFTGLGLLLYGLGWALLPEEEDGRIHTQQALTGDLTAGLSGAVFVTIGGLSSTDTGLVPHWWVSAWDSSFGGAVAAILWTALVLGCVYWGIRAARSHRARRQGLGGQPGQQAAWAQAQPQSQADHPIYPAQPGRPAPQRYPVQPGYPAQQSAGQAAPGAAPWQSAAQPTPQQAPGTRPTGVPEGAVAPAPWPGASRPAGAPQQVPAPTGPAYPGAVPPSTAPQAWGAQQSQTPAPRRPRKPKRPGPGRRTTLLVLGLTLLALAAVGALLATGRLHAVAAGLAAAGVLVTALGVGVLVSGLRGRRGGWMSWLAWPVVLFLAAPALVLGTVMPEDTVNAPVATDRVTVRPTAQQLDEAWWTTGSRTVDLGTYSAGGLTLDLRGLEDLTEDTTIDVAVGIGDIEVLTSQGQAVSVQASSGMGAVNGSLAEEWQVSGAVQTDQTSYSTYSTYDVNGSPAPGAQVWTSSPVGASATLVSPAARAAGAHLVTVRASVGSGMISVSEQADRVTWDGLKEDGYWVIGSWTDSNGRSHWSDELPVEGMTHRAVSDDVILTCLSEVLTGPDTSDDADGATYVDTSDLESLSRDQREKVDACVDAAITAGGGTTATAAPSDAPSTDPSSTPTSSPSKSTSAAPATPTPAATAH